MLEDSAPMQTPAKRWHQMGYSCDLWTDPPGKVWKDFRHTRDEILQVKQGRIEFEVDGKKSILGDGGEILIPAGALHTLRNIGGTTALWFYGYKF